MCFDIVLLGGCYGNKKGRGMDNVANYNNRYILGQNTSKSKYFSITYYTVELVGQFGRIANGLYSVIHLLSDPSFHCYYWGGGR